MWFREHPLPSAIIAASGFIFLGFFLVRSATPTERSSFTGPLARFQAQSLVADTPGRFDPTFKPETSVALPTILTKSLKPATSTSVKTPLVQLDTPPDALAQLKALLSPQAGLVTAQTSVLEELKQIYDLVPTKKTLLSVEKPRTSIQEDLHTYGNAAGAPIVQYFDVYEEQATIIDAWLKDRSNTSKKDRFTSLCNGLRAISTGLAAVQQVPEAVRAPHTALIQHYKAVGDSLCTLQGATDDTTLYEGMVAYNAAADTLARSYQQLVSVFQVAEVKFSNGEAGSVFQFAGL
jgi:hypothetical protein